MAEGYLSLVLHAHLPFVRHLDKEDRLEERWLFEALTESYIPLLKVFQQLSADGVDFRLTFSLSPPLISMLADELLQSRYEAYLLRLLELAESEVLRTESNPQLHTLALQYQSRFQEVHDFFLLYNRNILCAFREVWKSGKVELITSAATHAFLPYITTKEALRAQIVTAVNVFEAHFGARPPGIWLPECAFTPQVLPILKELSIRYFFVDTHALNSARPAPVFASFAPILTDAGIAAFCRDEECSRQVWSSDGGYPGDSDYREYYRDIGFDLDEDYVRPFIHQEGIRLNTGFKYYRITGTGHEKEPYHFERARDKAAEHAGNFLFNRQRQIEYIKQQSGRAPVVTAPYDAELFGHWWYEGPIFIDMLLRKMHYDQSEVRTITPSEYLGLYTDFQACQLFFSSWGRDGYGDVWLNGSNDWVYPALHDLEHKMRNLANCHPTADELRHRALNQAARELMLAESSDWAFIMDAKSAVDYAATRTKQHVNRFCALADMIAADDVDDEFLGQLEKIDNLFPRLDYRIYRTETPDTTPPLAEDAEQSKDRVLMTPSDTRARVSKARSLSVLMLSWEFPPMSVGGLSRHVYDLSRHLAQAGCEVHVVTMAIGGYPEDEVVEGVHVHRVRVLQPDGGAFIHFAFQLNLMMLDRCKTLIEEEGFRFDLIHAHDWLVAVAAKTLKERTGLPVIATVHATEHGRNHGIFTDTQRHIHHQEWVLTYEAQRVIVCSSYMKDEVVALFELPESKIDLLPNGVDSELLRRPEPNLPEQGNEFCANFGQSTQPGVDGVPKERNVLFVGRLVREKGVHLLIEAAPAILGEFPEVQFVIVGKGPMMDDLVTQAAEAGVSEHVTFMGYTDDNTRNNLLQTADVAVFPSLYEPFGIVALEAMAAGTPVVAADVGGLCDIVEHDHNGLKVYPNDPHSIAEQVKRVLGNPSFAKTLCNTASAELSRFDWKTIARGTVDVYRQVVHTGALADFR